MAGKSKKSARTKQFIIEKSAPVFNRKGYQGTSLHDLTRVTGLTKGSIYGNFDGKDEIAAAVYEFNSRQILDQIRKIVLSKIPATKKLYAITDFYRQLIYNPSLTGGCPILNTAVEADDTHEGLRQKVLESLDYLQRSFVYIINQGQARGELKQVDAQHYAHVFIALIEGGIMQMKIYRKSKYLKDCLLHMDQTISNMVS